MKALWQSWSVFPRIIAIRLNRMLICQALAHELHFASSDPLVRQYPVKLLRPS
jgi:hypothetical protein